MNKFFEFMVLLIQLSATIICCLLLTLLTAAFLLVCLYYLGLSEQLITIIVCGVAGVCGPIFIVWEVKEAIKEHNVTRRW